MEGKSAVNFGSSFYLWKEMPRGSLFMRQVSIYGSRRCMGGWPEYEAAIYVA